MNSQPFGDWEADENGTKGRKDYGKTEFGQDPDISVEDINHISHVPVTFTLSTPWMRDHLETIMCKFGRNRAICVVVEAICAKSLQTDRRRTQRDCVSSWNELKINFELILVNISGQSTTNV